MTRHRLWTVAAVVALAVASVASPAAQAATTRGAAFNMRLVGHHDLGNRGFNADVWVHEGFAYMGSWGFQDWSGGGENRFCPDDGHAGIVVLDARTPSRPTPVAKLQNPSGTSAEDVVVYTARYGTRAAAGTSPSPGSRPAAAPATTPACSVACRCGT
jgi:hypothetical protein